MLPLLLPVELAISPGMSTSVTKRSKKFPSEGESKSRHPTKSSSTREQIILAAEKLFAEHGIGNVSLRDIGIAAGQKNNMAVQYHFGNRDNLVREIAIYRSRFIEEIGIGLVAKFLPGQKPPEVRDLVHAYVISLANNLDDENYFLPFLSRFFIERGGIFALRDAVPANTISVMTYVMHQMLPDFPDRIIEERWQIVMTSAVHLLAGYQTARKAGALSYPLESLLEDLVRFLSAGLQAPPEVVKKGGGKRRLSRPTKGLGKGA
jgi:AcrR family transcriptional regulator